MRSKCWHLQRVKHLRAECGLDEMDSAEGLEGSKGWGVVSCKEMEEAPVCGVGQALKDIRAERGERRRGRVEEPEASVRNEGLFSVGTEKVCGKGGENYAKILNFAFCIPVI